MAKRPLPTKPSDRRRTGDRTRGIAHLDIQPQELPTKPPTPPPVLVVVSTGPVKLKAPTKLQMMNPESESVSRAPLPDTFPGGIAGLNDLSYIADGSGSIHRPRPSPTRSQWHRLATVLLRIWCPTNPTDRILTGHIDSGGAVPHRAPGPAHEASHFILARNLARGMAVYDRRIDAVHRAGCRPHRARSRPHRPARHHESRSWRSRRFPRTAPPRPRYLG